MPELSSSRGPHPALREETIFESLSQMARRLPAHEALVVRYQNARLTYRERKERVEDTARGKVQKFIIREQEIRERGLEEVARIATA